MRLSHKRSAVADRRGRIIQQLDRLRSRLVKKSPSSYRSEKLYRLQSNRSRELISDLEDELLILNCPGEYEELPIAVVADELGLEYAQVRNLIKRGEIRAAGRAAHERINRSELERIAAVGVPELLRLSQQECAEIFEQALPHLQRGDVEAAKRAYQRMEARQSWRGPYAPAFLVGLELANGEIDAALSSFKLILEYEDPLRRIVIMHYLGRVLRGVRLKECHAQELCAKFITLSDGVTSKLTQIEEYNIAG